MAPVTSWQVGRVSANVGILDSNPLIYAAGGAERYWTICALERHRLPRPLLVRNRRRSASPRAALSACASSIGYCLLITAFSRYTVVLIIPDLADSSP